MVLFAILYCFRFLAPFFAQVVAVRPGLAGLAVGLAGDVASGVIVVVPGAVREQAVGHAGHVAAHVAVAVGIEAVVAPAGAGQLTVVVVAVVGGRAVVRLRGQAIGRIVAVDVSEQRAAAAVLVLDLGDVADRVVAVLRQPDAGVPRQVAVARQRRHLTVRRVIQVQACLLAVGTAELAAGQPLRRAQHGGHLTTQRIAHAGHVAVLVVAVGQRLAERIGDGQHAATVIVVSSSRTTAFGAQILHQRLCHFTDFLV